MGLEIVGFERCGDRDNNEQQLTIRPLAVGTCLLAAGNCLGNNFSAISGEKCLHSSTGTYDGTAPGAKTASMILY
jgi:hypothetical protein